MFDISRLTIAILVVSSVLRVAASQVPARLPAPDAKPGSAEKPVKVYILAGQSNMVGMGDLRGARNIYTGIYLGSDPALAEESLEIYRVGKFKFSKLRIYQPDGTRTDEAIAKGQLEVPLRGVYRASCKVAIDGEPVEKDVRLEPGKRYGFELSGFTGSPPRFWLEKVDLLGNGDLESVVKRERKFPWLVDGEGRWSVRRDVWFQEARIAKDGEGSPLSATSNGKSIGPELGFGFVMGQFHDEQVLLIKTAMGNRSLGFDFRPPSSGRTDPDNKWESLEYKLMVEGVRKTLANIEKVVPGYAGQGYEIAGFAWFQGHKDSGAEATISEYEKHLANLIRDVRKEFAVPRLPVVVATVGFGGDRMPDKFLRILRSQMAVSDAERYPEFRGSVASVDTRSFWREVDESPRNQDYHYNRNAETYLLIGDALGRAMVKLRGGSAEPRTQDPRPRALASEQPGERSQAAIAAAKKAAVPMILNGVVSSYVSNPRFEKALAQEASGERPKRTNQFLRGAMFGLVNCYRAAGVTDYDWRPFGVDLDAAEWDYFSFDPSETQPKKKGSRYRKVTYPEGMARWFAPEFDPRAIGWPRGRQPFGQLDGKLAPLSETCSVSFCRCGEVPKTLWSKEVILVRGTFAVPRLKEGHRYRILVGGSAHVNAGEGYAIWINGKLLAESKVGVGRRQGGQPRGAYISNEFRPEFEAGEVTIAAVSFLRYNHPRHGLRPPRGHLSLRLEEQMLPPLKR